MKVRGYDIQIPINSDALVGPWLAAKSAAELVALDSGDILNSASTTDRPSDHALGPIEITQGILAEYRQHTVEAVRAGLARDGARVEHARRQRNTLAAMIVQLDWNPAFHIKNTAYLDRVTDLLRQVTHRDARVFSELYHMSLAAWQEGGACLRRPVGSHDGAEMGLTVDTTVTACQTVPPTLDKLGNCVDIANQALTLATSALAVYSGPDATIEFVDISNIALTPETRQMLGVPADQVLGHVFLQVRTADGLSIWDPAAIGYRVPKPATYLVADPWRRSIADYHYRRGSGLDDQGEWGAALQEYDRAIAIDPTDPSSHIHRAITCVRLERFEEAELDYRAALQYDPRSVAAWAGLGDLYVRMSKPMAAIEASSHATIADPSYVVGWVNLGLGLMSADRLAEAVNVFRTALEVDPQYGNAYQYLETAQQRVKLPTIQQ
ncbi:MAG: tetratricopeptide repeat protein [Deltaproteobacteria bacterium]|nr:tetratricopeptide repeat protein [Deltaproteobacteria bacterium]